MRKLSVTFKKNEYFCTFRPKRTTFHDFLIYNVKLIKKVKTAILKTKNNCLLRIHE